MRRLKILTAIAAVFTSLSVPILSLAQTPTAANVVTKSPCAAIIEASGPELTDRLIHGHALLYLDTHSPESDRSVSEQNYQLAKWDNIINNIPEDLLAEFFYKLKAEVEKLSPEHERAQQAEAEARERRLQDEEEEAKAAEDQNLIDIGELRIHPVTGKRIIRDYTYPKLGEAYRNEQGLIWGAVVKYPDSSAHIMNWEDAKKYCTDLGFSLPTKEQFEQLAQDMGRGSDVAGENQGYRSQFIHKGVEVDFLPDILDQFWSSSMYPNSTIYGFFFSGRDGAYDYYGELNLSHAVRCIAVGR